MNLIELIMILIRKNDEFKLCVEYKKDFDECFKRFK